MNEMTISEKIRYIEASDHPLSADIGMIKEENTSWLYDVGNGADSISGLNGSYSVVLSHFHADHIGNIGKISMKELYVSKETSRHLPKEITVTGGIHIVSEPVRIGNLHIFPVPSSHAKGSLGLEIGDTYAFVGDALYSKIRPDGLAYNAQLLKDEIHVLENLHAPFLLVSHFKGLIRKKEEVIAELEAIYRQRKQNEPEIWIERKTGGAP